MTILLIGATGTLGSALRAQAFPGEVMSTWRERPLPQGIRFDAKEDDPRRLLSGLQGRPSHAVLLFGRTQIDACARDPAGSRDVNVSAMIRLLTCLKSEGITPVYCSTDGVFDGGGRDLREDAPPNPILEYGRQKAEMETFIASEFVGRPHLILRYAKLVGLETGRRNLLGEWVDDLERGREIRLAKDQYFSPASLADAAKATLECARKDLTGIYHVGGPERLSRIEIFEIVRRVYERLQEVTSVVTYCRLNDLPFLEPRPLDASINSEKLYQAIGRRFASVAELCECEMPIRLRI